jgi:hypothetical protein
VQNLNNLSKLAYINQFKTAQSDDNYIYASAYGSKLNSFDYGINLINTNTFSVINTLQREYMTEEVLNKILIHGSNLFADRLTLNAPTQFE